MAKNTLKLPTVVGEHLEICRSQMATISHKLSTMIGESFEIYFMLLNCPSWLEKILKFADLK